MCPEDSTSSVCSTQTWIHSLNDPVVDAELSCPAIWNEVVP